MSAAGVTVRFGLGVRVRVSYAKKSRLVLGRTQWLCSCDLSIFNTRFSSLSGACTIAARATCSVLLPRSVGLGDGDSDGGVDGDGDGDGGGGDSGGDG